MPGIALPDSVVIIRDPNASAVSCCNQVNLRTDPENVPPGIAERFPLQMAQLTIVVNHQSFRLPARVHKRRKRRESAGGRQNRL
jgi:hypothetical protein